MNKIESKNFFDHVDEKIASGLKTEIIPSVERVVDNVHSNEAFESYLKNLSTDFANCGIFLCWAFSFKYISAEKLSVELVEEEVKLLRQKCLDLDADFNQIVTLTYRLLDNQYFMNRFMDFVEAYEKQYTDEIVFEDKRRIISNLLNHLDFEFNMLDSVATYINQEDKYTTENLVKLGNLIFESASSKNLFHLYEEFNTDEEIINHISHALDMLVFIKGIIIAREYVDVLKYNRSVYGPYTNIWLRAVEYDNIEDWKESKVYEDILAKAEEVFEQAKAKIEEHTKLVEPQKEQEPEEPKKKNDFKVEDAEPEEVIYELINNEFQGAYNFFTFAIDDKEFLASYLAYIAQKKTDKKNVISDEAREQILADIDEFIFKFGTEYKDRINIIASDLPESERENIHQTLNEIFNNLIVSDNRLIEVILMYRKDESTISTWSHLFEILSLIENQRISGSLHHLHTFFKELLTNHIDGDSFAEIVESLSKFESLITLAGRTREFLAKK